MCILKREIKKEQHFFGETTTTGTFDTYEYTSLFKQRPTTNAQSKTTNNKSKQQQNHKK